MAGCVSTDLNTIAPQSVADLAPVVDLADVEVAAADFANRPDKPEGALAVPAADAPPNAGPLVAVAAYVQPPPLPPSPDAPVHVLIAKYAAHYGLPESFVRKVVKRESNFNPRAINRGHWGLMQIKHQTARSMGYRGSAEGLLDAETNLIYSVKYLRGAWLVAKGDEARADRLYQSGYYYHAKAAGLLEATGLGRDRVRKRRRDI